MGENIEGFHVTRDGARLWFRYEPSGDGPPLVLCDGLGCDGFIWPYIMDRFRRGHPILRWHYRGHGRSSRPTNLATMTVQHLVDDLHTLIQDLGIRPAVLMGHSLGVQVIFEHYRRHADEVVGLVPLCGSYGRPADTFYGTDRLRPVLRTAIHLARTMPGISNGLWKTFVPSRLGMSVAKLVELNGRRIRDADMWPYFEGLGRVDADVFFALLDAAIEHTTRDILEQIDVPVQIIAGARDGFTPLVCSEEMRRRIPDSDLLVFSDGTHTAPIEYPAEVEASLEAFLGRVQAKQTLTPAQAAAR